MAVLQPEVYHVLINKALNIATQLGLSLNESDVKQGMPKRCVLSRLIRFFGKHIVCERKQHFSEFITG